MAYEAILQSFSFPAAGDVSSNQYFFGILSTAGQVKVPTSCGRGLCMPIGVILDKSTAAGVSTKVALEGISKVVCGDSSGMDNAITFNIPLVCSSQGKAVPSTATGFKVAGIALANVSTGATATIIPILLTPGGGLST